MRPLNRQARSQMTNGRLSCVVRCLRLRHIDHSTRHRPNHDHAACGFTLDQVSSDSGSEEVCPIHVDSPKLLDTIERVGNGIEILGKASRGDQVVNLAMITYNFFNGRVDGVRIGDVGVVGGNLGSAVGASA